MASSERGGQLYDGDRDAVVLNLLGFGAGSLEEGQGREQSLRLAWEHGQPLHVSPTLQVVAGDEAEQQRRSRRRNESLLRFPKLHLKAKHAGHLR